MQLSRHQLRPLIVPSLPFISALLLFGAFVNYRLSWLVLFGLVPYLFFLQVEVKKAQPRLVFITWLMGLFFMLFTVGWLIATDTQGWIQIGGLRLQIIIFALWLTFGIALSLGFVLFGLLIRYFSKRISFFQLTVLVLPIGWALCEFARSWLLSIIVSGRGASIGANWNFGALGLALTATPLGYMSRWLGLYGMSMVAVVINVTWFWLWYKRYQLVLVTWVVIGLLGFGCRFLGEPHPIKTVRVTTVQLSSDDNDYYDALAQRLTRTSTIPTNILALPEYSYFFEDGSSPQRQAVASAAFGSQRGLIIYTRKGPVKQGFPTNQMVVADRNGYIISAQEKSFLIPTGEYIPWIVAQPLHWFGQTNIINSFNNGIAVAKSDTLEQPIAAHGFNVGVLACSGVISSSLYRHLATSGAQLLVNSASLNQFRNATWYHQQARQFARFQAVANDRPFIQSARGGFSFIMDQNGHFLVDFPKQGLAAGSANVTAMGGRTLYSLVGEWTVVFGAIGLAAYAVRLRR